MATVDMKPGDQVFLTPRTLNAPSICWREPKVTVKTFRHPYVIVIGPDEQEHEIHEDNVVRRRPDRRPRRPARPPRPRLPEGAEQNELW